MLRNTAILERSDSGVCVPPLYRKRLAIEGTSSEKMSPPSHLACTSSPIFVRVNFQNRLEWQSISVTCTCCSAHVPSRIIGILHSTALRVSLEKIIPSPCSRGGNLQGGPKAFTIYIYISITLTIIMLYCCCCCVCSGGILASD